jgi:hypothetical protein
MTIRLESSAPHVVAPESHAGPFTDWGVIPTMIEGESRTSGAVLHKGPNGESEKTERPMPITPQLWYIARAQPL